MADNNMFIMAGLGMAGLWFMNRQRGSQEDQVEQLAGAAMMASGEGTAPDAPFFPYSSASNPSFFFNEGGQMTEVPGAPIPFAASSGEDIGKYPGGGNPPELEFEVARGLAVGTSDNSPNTPQFSASGDAIVVPSTIWNDQAAIAVANAMPLLAIQDTQGGGIEILGSNVDIATLSSKEQFRAVSFSDPTGDIKGGFTTTADVLAEYVSGFNEPTPYVARTWQEIEAESGLSASQKAAAGDEDIGAYPGGGNPPELEFTVARSFPPDGTSDISPTTPQFAGDPTFIVTPSTVWDQQSYRTPPSQFLGVQPAVSTGAFFAVEGGAFGPSAIETVQSTLRPEPIEDLRPDHYFRSGAQGDSAWSSTLGGWGEG